MSTGRSFRALRILVKTLVLSDYCGCDCRNAKEEEKATAIQQKLTVAWAREVEMAISRRYDTESILKVEPTGVAGGMDLAWE